MRITSTTKSKVAARINNYLGKNKKQIVVTVSEHSPESVRLTGFLPKTKGWRVVTAVPIRKNNRKDYVKFLAETNEKEIWIKVATAGGRSKIYVR